MIFNKLKGKPEGYIKGYYDGKFGDVPRLPRSITFTTHHSVYNYVEGYAKGLRQRHLKRAIASAIIVLAGASYYISRDLKNTKEMIASFQDREQNIVQFYQEYGTLPKDFLRAYDMNDLERGVEGERK